MPRKKILNPEKVLSHPLTIRVTEKEYKRLDKIRNESDCKSIGEVARRILSNKVIHYFHKDISLHGPMEELALIRKELKAIGININQQTHRFHASSNDTQRAYHALKTSELYSMVDPKVDKLLTIVSKLAERWLQGY
mgnify:CR=1 FL=1